MKKIIILLLTILCAQFVSATIFPLTSSGSWKYEVQSADNVAKVVFVCDNDVCSAIRNSPGSDVVEVTNAASPTISEQGVIVFVNATNNEMYKLVSGTITQVTTGGSFFNYKYFPRVCPDNDTVVYCGTDTSGNNHVYKASLSTPGAPIKLNTTDTNSSCNYAQNPAVCDNNFAYYVDYNGSYMQIFKTPLALGPRTQITTGNSEHSTPSLSRDLTKILYNSNEVSSYDIYSINIDGTNKQQISFSTPNEQWPYETSDGRIVCLYRNATGASGWRIKQVYPTEQFYNDTLPVYWYPFTTSQGSSDIFFTGYNDGQVYQDYTPDPSDPVPEFSSITLLLAALVALGGIFAFRRFR